MPTKGPNPPHKPEEILVKDGKTESETAQNSSSEVIVFEKEPWLLASEIHPAHKTFTSNYHSYCYPSYDEAEIQLALLKGLLAENYPELAQIQIVESSHHKTPFNFSISDEQHQALKMLQGHPRLIKSIRWDALCFWMEFIHGMTRSEQKIFRQLLRRGDHRAFTVFPDGVYPYDQKPSPYPERRLAEKKAKRSQHQSTTLVSYKIPSPVFGHGKDRMNKLAGVLVDAEDALMNRYFIYDGGTVSRPYERETLEEAQAYHQRVTHPDHPLLFATREAFEAALAKQLDQHNEVLARIRWNVTSSAIGIFSDTFEARCVAQYYADQMYHRVKAQYQESGKPWDNTYQVPILYYLPNDEKNWTSYSKNTRNADKQLAEEIYKDEKEYQKRIEANNGEFLLLLDNPEEVWSRLINDASHPLLTMMNHEQFQLVEALYQRTGLAQPFNEALADYGKTLTTKTKDSMSQSILNKVINNNKPGFLKFSLTLGNENFVNSYDIYGNSILTIAAGQGHLDIVKALLKVKGIKVNELIYRGRTPLGAAAYQGHLDVVKALLEVDAIRINVNKYMKGRQTALFIAAAKGHSGVVKALLKVDCINIDIPDKYGITPLAIAVQQGYLHVVKAFVEANGINKTDYYGKTPLFIAVYYGQIDIVKALLEFDSIDVNKPNNYGETPLYVAAFNGQLDVVKALLEFDGIDVNKVAPQGRTPLLIAADLGHIDVMIVLLKAQGIDINQDMDDDQAPLEKAEAVKQKYILLYLEQIKKNPENQQNPCRIIQNAIRDYVGHSNNHMVSGIHRFFHGHWNRHHTATIFNLLNDDKFKKNEFDKEMLQNFVDNLRQNLGDQKLNPKGDLAAILKLTNTLVGIDFYSTEPVQITDQRAP